MKTLFEGRHGAGEWIDEPGALARFADHVALAKVVALDTEANSLHAYRERTCLVQVTADGQNGVLDALALVDLSPLRLALERDDVEVVFHGGDYDISVLSRDHGFRFRRVFDTMIAATLLGDERVGLADLVYSAFGAELDKRYQKADWARRPLSADHLDYLVGDTVHLVGLRDLMGARLRAADLVEEAEIEFRRLATRVGKPLAADPEGWRRLKGAERLPPEARSVLRALHAWREHEAELRDLPPFKVLGPASMLAAADLAARGERGEAHRVPGLAPGESARHGRAVLDAIREGLDDAASGDLPSGDERPRLDPDAARAIRRARIREDALRDWRRNEAARRKVPNVVVLPNPALDWLVTAMPSTPEELAAHPDIGPKRARLYAADILSVLFPLR